MVTVLLTWRYPHCHEYFYLWQYAFLGVFFSCSFSRFRVYWPGWLGHRRKPPGLVVLSPRPTMITLLLSISPQPLTSEGGDKAIIGSNT